MKPFAWACAGTIAAAGIFTSFSAHAQVVIAADELRPGNGADYRGSYAAVPVRRPPPDESAMMSPQELIGFLRADGFSPLGPAMRRGWVYTIAVLDQNGDDGRLIVDGRTGEPIRFIPAMRIDGPLNEELDSMYGPPGPPPAAFASDPYLRRAPRPPAGVPKVARTPAAQPHSQAAARPANGPAQSAAIGPKAPPGAAPTPAATQATSQPALDQAKPDTKPAEAVTAQASPPTTASTAGQTAKSETTKPADIRPAPAELKPTQPMPPVQPLE